MTTTVVGTAGVLSASGTAAAVLVVSINGRKNLLRLVVPPMMARVTIISMKACDNLAKLECCGNEEQTKSRAIHQCVSDGWCLASRHQNEPLVLHSQSLGGRGTVGKL